jgi:hypothetical protein
MDDKLTEAVRTVSDLIISLEDYDDHGECKFNRALKRMFFDILSFGKFGVIPFDQRKDVNGRFVSHSMKTTLNLECIEWIKDNLDVWEVRELPAASIDYELRMFNRKFLFFRKDLPMPNFKELR